MSRNVNNNNKKYNDKQSNRSTTSNKRNNPKGKRNSKTGSRKEVEFNIEERDLNKADLPHIITGSKVNNDPAWYRNVGNLTQDVSRYQFNYPIGLDIDMRSEAPASGQTGNRVLRIPGIVQLEYMPTYGYSSIPTSAINIAAQQLYTLVRKANSGRVNFDKTDLMMTIMAMDSAYMMYEEFVRAYKTLGDYNYQSRYVPDALLFAEGFSSNLASEMANMKKLIDLFAYKLASINIPDQFDFIRRHSWLNSNVYKDDNSARAQLYLYRPGGYYVWTEGQNNQPTSLVYTGVSDITGKSNPAYQTVADMEKAMNTLMDPILGSDDIGIMSGELAKAFPESNMIKVQLIDEHMFIDPVYDSEVLNQIMNTTILSVDNRSAVVTVDNSNLITGPYIQFRPLCYTTDTSGFPYNEKEARKDLLNLHDLEPTEDNVMVITRNISRPNGAANYTLPDGTTNISGRKVLCGTEVFENIRYFLKNSSTGEVTFTEVQTDVFYDPAVGAPAIIATMQKVMRKRAFDYAPISYIWVWNSGQSQYDLYSTDLDIDNYQAIGIQDLENLHEVALMSLFAVRDYNTNM